MIAQLALRDAVERLKSAGVPDPARDARILLAFALGVTADRLTLHLADPISEDTQSQFDALIEQRVNRQPVSQIIGTRQFYGREFIVTSEVLDPRPETETLVEEAIKIAPESIFDLGTGSGCLLLSILAECPAARGVGLDISDAALNVAKENAAKLALENRVMFSQSDWFASASGSYDLIVSNPPYIDESEWKTLDPEPRLWEPKIALTPGSDGLAPYRILARDAVRFIKPNGWLMVEIGWTQGPAVRQIFTEQKWQNVRVVQDMGGKDRVVIGQRG